jgi:hypothetical protein
MSILAQIVIDQRKEIALKKQMISQAQLQDMPHYNRKAISFADAIKYKTTIPSCRGSYRI